MGMGHDDKRQRASKIQTAETNVYLVLASQTIINLTRENIEDHLCLLQLYLLGIYFKQ